MNKTVIQYIQNNLRTASPQGILEAYFGFKVIDHIILLKSYKEKGYQGYPTWFIAYGFKDSRGIYLLMICGLPLYSKVFRVKNFDSFRNDLENATSSTLLKLMYESSDIIESKFNIEEGYRILNYLMLPNTSYNI